MAAAELHPPEAVSRSGPVCTKLSLKRHLPNETTPPVHPAETPSGTAMDGASCAAAPPFDAWPTCGLEPSAGDSAVPAEGTAVPESAAKVLFPTEETSSSTVGMDCDCDAEKNGKADGLSDDAKSATAGGVEADAKGVTQLPTKAEHLEAKPAVWTSASTTGQVAVAAPISFPPTGVHDDASAEEKPSSSAGAETLLPSSVPHRPAESGAMCPEGWNNDEMCPAAFLYMVTAVESEISDEPGTLEKLALEDEASENEDILSAPTSLPADGVSGGAVMSSEAGLAVESTPTPPLDATGHASLPAAETPEALVVDTSPPRPPSFPESIPPAPVEPEPAPTESKQQVRIDSSPFLSAPTPFEIFGQTGEESTCPSRRSSLEEAHSAAEPLVVDGGAMQHDDDGVPSASGSEVVITDVGAREAQEDPLPILPAQEDEPTVAATPEGVGDPVPGTCPGASVDSSQQEPEMECVPSLPEPEDSTSVAKSYSSDGEHISSGTTSDLESIASMNAGATQEGVPLALLSHEDRAGTAEAVTQDEGRASVKTLQETCPAVTPTALSSETCTDATTTYVSTSHAAEAEEEQDPGTARDDSWTDAISHPLSPTPVTGGAKVEGPGGEESGARLEITGHHAAESTKLDDAINTERSLDATLATTPCFPPAVLVTPPPGEAELVCLREGARVETQEEGGGEVGDESGGGGGVGGPAVGRVDGDGDDASLESLVQEFNAWVASAGSPVRKVEAGLVGNGMRLGLVTTEAIEEGEPYLSIPESIVLDASKVRELWQKLAAASAWYCGDRVRNCG